jgi:hypothetical protein
MLNDKPFNSTFYAEIGTYNVVGKDYYGNVTVQNQSGLYIDASVSSGSNQTGFFRFDSNVITQLLTIDITGKHGTWDFAYPDLPDVDATQSNSSKQIIRGHRSAFAQYYVTTDATSTTVVDGWIIVTTLLSISANDYTYNKMMLKQLTDDGQIFDPFPTQIVGNIKCKTDTNQVVLGNFEVASALTKFDAFYWAPGLSVYKHKSIESPDSISKILNKYSDTTGFWINF